MNNVLSMQDSAQLHSTGIQISLKRLCNGKLVSERVGAFWNSAITE